MKAGGRRPDTGDRRPEAGGRKPEAGAGGRTPETGGGGRSWGRWASTARPGSARRRFAQAPRRAPGNGMARDSARHGACAGAALGRSPARGAAGCIKGVVDMFDAVASVSMIERLAVVEKRIGKQSSSLGGQISDAGERHRPQHRRGEGAARRRPATILGHRGAARTRSRRACASRSRRATSRGRRRTPSTSCSTASARCLTDSPTGDDHFRPVRPGQATLIIAAS